jgi:hypothetical protein
MIRTFQSQLLAVVCLLAGAGLAMATAGIATEDRTSQQERLREFQELPPETQRLVRSNYTLFQSLPASEQERLRQLSEVMESSENLKTVAADYLEWWKALSQSEYEAFHKMDEAEQLAFVTRKWSRRLADQREIVVQFEGPESVRMPPLTMNFDEIFQCLSKVYPEADRSKELSRDLEALQRVRHKALRLTLQAFEDLRSSTQPRSEIEQRGDAFRTALLETISDQEWKQRFVSLSDRFKSTAWGATWNFMHLFRILDQVTVALGEDLQKEFPVTGSQMIDAFASIEDKAIQRSLMAMPVKDARARLELMAQAAVIDSPEQKLLKKFQEYTRHRSSYMQMRFGFGSGGTGFFRPGVSRPPGSPPQRKL